MYQYIYIYECMRKQTEVHRKKGQRSGEVRCRVSEAIAGPMHGNKINKMSCIGQKPVKARCRISATGWVQPVPRFGINFLTSQHRPMHRNKSYPVVRMSGGEGSALTAWEHCNV